MDREINEFLKKEFSYRIQEWVQLINEIKNQFSYELFDKIQHIEEVITTAVRYKFSEKPDATLKTYRYMESLLED